MARKKGQTYSAEKKVQIILELLKEEQTVGQLASKYQITAKSIQNWKKQFLENAAIAMEPAKALSEYKSQLEAKDEEISEKLEKVLNIYISLVEEKEKNLTLTKKIINLNKKCNGEQLLSEQALYIAKQKCSEKNISIKDYLSSLVIANI